MQPSGFPQVATRVCAMRAVICNCDHARKIDARPSGEKYALAQVHVGLKARLPTGGFLLTFRGAPLIGEKSSALAAAVLPAKGCGIQGWRVAVGKNSTPCRLGQPLLRSIRTGPATGAVRPRMAVLHHARTHVFAV